MDRLGFRTIAQPDLVRQPPRHLVEKETRREIDATKTTPAPDSRFRAYAAPLSDGRLVTDYRDKCTTRAPPGQNFAVKQWTIHNANEIARISRFRQVQNTGQALGTAQTELPPAVTQRCDVNGCRIEATAYPDGIGIERLDKAPPLFGTFSFPPTPGTLAKNRNFTSLNRYNEYGRNTANRWAPDNLYQ